MHMSIQLVLFIYIYEGSICFDKSNVKINKCIFTNNTSYGTSFSVRSASYGGAIYMTNTTCNLTFSDFYNPP